MVHMLVQDLVRNPCIEQWYMVQRLRDGDDPLLLNGTSTPGTYTGSPGSLVCCAHHPDQGCGGEIYMSNKPRILFFDLETIGVNALKADLGLVCCFGYKWAGDKRAKCLILNPTALKRFDDRALLRQASRLFNEADLVVGHYASVFDRRFLQGRLLINGLDPIAPTKMRDTCFMARKIGNYSSNRLGHLCKILGCENQKIGKGKGSICEWPKSWFKVMQGDMRALAGMARYCIGDVEALEELYNKLKVFDSNHPYVGSRAHCAACGGDVQYRGTMLVLSGRRRRFQCKVCAKWGYDAKAIKN